MPYPSNRSGLAYVLAGPTGVGWKHDERAYSMGNLGLLVAAVGTSDRQIRLTNSVNSHPYNMER